MTVESHPLKAGASLSVTPTPALNATSAIGVFHQWIQAATAPGLLIDVADYSHVEQGPGVLLVAHEGEYGLRFEAGRSDFGFRRRRGGPATVGAALRDACVYALQGCVLLADAGLIEPAVGANCALSLFDRSAVVDDGFAGDASAVLDALYGAGAYKSCGSDGNPRGPVTMRADGSPAAAGELLARLQS